MLAGAGAAIEELADRTGALLATSAMAHGLFAGSPYALGIAGGFACPHAAELLAESDVIVSFGATLNHWTTCHGALLGPGTQLIQADLDAAAIGAHQPAHLGIVGDAAATAQALLSELAVRDHQAPGRRTPEIAQAIGTHRWRDEPYDDAPAPDTIDPRTLAIALNDLLPADRAVAVDSGAFTGWPAMYLDVADARAWLFCNAFQSVGLSLGAAIGAAVARGAGRITVAAVGDGGLFLALPELDTAARLGLPLLIVVCNDAAYGAEVHHFGPMGWTSASRSSTTPTSRPSPAARACRRSPSAHPPSSPPSPTGPPTRAARCWSTRRSIPASPATGSPRRSATDPASIPQDGARHAERAPPGSPVSRR